MRIFIVEHKPGVLSRPDLQDKLVFRRAVVVSINEESAVNWVKAAIEGEEVFSAHQDEGKFARVIDKPFFDPDACTATAIGEETLPDVRGSRILCWELAPPVPSGSDV
jgi:hypothetical protein